LLLFGSLHRLGRRRRRGYLRALPAIARGVFMRTRDDLLELFLVFLLFEKVGHIEKGIALQADIDKRRLHARQHARDAPFVNGSRERVFVLAFKIDFS